MYGSIVFGSGEAMEKKVPVISCDHHGPRACYGQGFVSNQCPSRTMHWGTYVLSGAAVCW